MTICIACTCEQDSKNPKNGRVIAVSDRMITVDALMLEFEHALPKLEEITQSSLVMLAGDALTPTDVLRDVKSHSRKEKITDLRSLARLLSEVLAEHRKRLVEENVLGPRGFGSFEEYYQKASSLPSDLVRSLDQEIVSFEEVHEIAGVNVLLAGLDDTGPHLYLITNPGTATCFDAIGYHAIGSGDSQAIATISSYGYVDTFGSNTALYVAYDAKRKAERAPGVGRETDIRIVDSKGIHEISAESATELEKIYLGKASSDSKWLGSLPDFRLP